MPEQPGTADVPPCTCRPWVEQQLERLRADLAEEVRTNRLRLGREDQPHIVIETRPGVAEIGVSAGSGLPMVSIVASIDDTGVQAGVSVTADGDVVGSFHVTATGGSTTPCRLVFDDTRNSHWLVVDHEGLRVES
jgi:hypothetical protein